MTVSYRIEHADHGDGLLETVAGASPSGYNEQCGLFEFVLISCITGLMCLLGFAGNTLSFITLWQQKTASASVFLLQAALIADMAVIWMLFVGDVIPSLGYIIPVLRHCEAVCDYVHMVVRPLLFLGQTSMMWFTLLAAATRYVVMCKPAYASMCCTVAFARKQAMVTIGLATLLTAPLTFDKAVVLSHSVENRTVSEETLSQNWWYSLIYINILTYLLAYIVPMVLLLYIAGKISLLLHNVKRLRRVLATTYKAQNTDLAQVLLILAIAACLCYLPLVTLRGLVWAHGQVQSHCGNLQYYIDCFSKMFQALNSSIKILILSLFAKRFRDSLRENFACMQGKKSGEVSIFGMYKCQDMSEMTLISQVDNRL